MSRFIYLLFWDCDAPGSSLASPMQCVPNRSPMRRQQVAILAKPGTFSHLNLNHHWTEILCYLDRKHTVYRAPLKYLPIPKEGVEQILEQKMEGLELGWLVKANVFYFILKWINPYVLLGTFSSTKGCC